MPVPARRPAGVHARYLSLAFLLASGGGATPPAPMPVPERQSAEMAALYASAHAAAAVASTAATPELLAFMDDAVFRANLTACCPGVAQLPAPELLARYRAELEVVEMVHNFDAEPGSRHDDVDVAIGQESSYFQNLWELQYLQLVNKSESCGNFMNWAEQKLYGFPALTGDDNCPRSFVEAANRPIYVAFNQLKIDVGNPNFGDITAVFRRDYVRNMTVIAAVDTGLWEMTCNASSVGPSSHFHHAPRNCSAWDPTGLINTTTVKLPVGTLDHYDHLVLANPRWFNGTVSLSDTFARLLGGDGEGGGGWGAQNVSNSNFVTYWESNFAGNVMYDRGGSPGDGINFLVANFPALFGTAFGQRVRAWAKSRGWFLAWALGDDVSPQGGGGGSHHHGGGPPQMVRMNKRILDPAVLAATSAANLSDVKGTAAAAAFDALYEDAAVARSKTNITTAEWASRYAVLAAALPAGASVQPLYAGACADTDRCMGVDLSGYCICYSQ